jgi:hypothetical protein
MPPPIIRLLDDVVMACCSGPQALHPLIAIVAATAKAVNHFMHQRSRQIHAQTNPGYRGFIVNTLLTPTTR